MKTGEGGLWFCRVNFGDSIEKLVIVLAFVFVVAVLLRVRTEKKEMAAPAAIL